MFRVGINLKKWNATGVKRQADAIGARRVLKAANYLQQRIRRNISESTRLEGPSKAGEYPHRVTGYLHKTIFRRPVRSMRGPAQDVGTKVTYGVLHELGERPFITRTYYEQRGAIIRILAGESAPTMSAAAMAREARARATRRAGFKAMKQAERADKRRRKQARRRAKKLIEKADMARRLERRRKRRKK